MGDRVGRERSPVTRVRGLCRGCGTVAPLRVFVRGGQVWQEGRCSRCRRDPNQPEVPPALIAADARWYLDRMAAEAGGQAAGGRARRLSRGCPRSCGPCAWHATACQTVVLAVGGPGGFLPLQTLLPLVRGALAGAAPAGTLRIEGSGAALHPDLESILDAARTFGAGALVVKASSTALADDAARCDALARAGARVLLAPSQGGEGVRACDAPLPAETLRAVARLGDAGAQVELHHVLTGSGEDLDVLRGLLDLVATRDHVVGMAVETPSDAASRGRPLPLDEAASVVCAASDGRLALTDFGPRSGAHPLCYGVCLALAEGGRLVPIRPPTGAAEIVRPGAKSIAVHAPMLPETLDCSRAMLCPDLVAAGPDRLVPGCVWRLLHRPGADTIA